jgi:hypothetical protein
MFLLGMGEWTLVHVPVFMVPLWYFIKPMFGINFGVVGVGGGGGGGVDDGSVDHTTWEPSQFRNEDGTYFCPKPGCVKVGGNSFKRRDNWRAHVSKASCGDGRRRKRHRGETSGSNTDSEAPRAEGSCCDHGHHPGDHHHHHDHEDHQHAHEDHDPTNEAIARQLNELPDIGSTPMVTPEATPVTTPEATPPTGPEHGPSPAATLRACPGAAVGCGIRRVGPCTGWSAGDVLARAFLGDEYDKSEAQELDVREHDLYEEESRGAGADADGGAEVGVDAMSMLESVLTAGAADFTVDEDEVLDLLLAEEMDELTGQLADELAVDEVVQGADKEGGGNGEDVTQDGAQTVQSLVRDKNKPIVDEGVQVTVLQAAYLMLSLKREGKIRDNIFDMLCRVISEVLLPPGNRFPKSLYLMRRVLGCRAIDEVSIHVCVNDCDAWGFVSATKGLPKSQRPHRDDACDHCGEKKFTVKGGKLTPRKTFLYFGIQNAIRRLFTSSDFVRLRGMNRDTNAYYNSQEATRLHEAAGVSMDNQCASVYDIGLDWGQLYEKAVYSMGLIVLRCADLPPTHRSQRRFCMPVALIPGPKEPQNLWTYLKFVADEFAGGARDDDTVQHDFENGTKLHAKMRVEPCDGQEFDHIFLCSGVHGDTPAQRKVSCLLSHAAYLGCPYCVLRGVPGPDGHGMYFPTTATQGARFGLFAQGERDKIRSEGLGASTAVPADVGGSHIKLDHEDQVTRGVMVDNGSARATDVGSKGLSPFVKWLPYLHYNNAFPVPVAHAALQGVCRMLLRITIDGMSNAQKRVVKSRTTNLSEPSDVGRRYKCFLTKLGTYTMEDFVNFLEFGCIRMLDGVVDADVASLWTSFRTGILYFLREKKVDGVAQNVDDAYKALYTFSKKLYDQFGITACRYNVHVLLCRVRDQELACGAIRQCTEFWIEMLVQFAKSSVRYRTTKFPEKVLGMDWCTDEGLQCQASRCHQTIP